MREEKSDRGLSRLFNLMCASWVFFGQGDKVQTQKEELFEDNEKSFLLEVLEPNRLEDLA